MEKFAYATPPFVGLFDNGSGESINGESGGEFSEEVSQSCAIASLRHSAE